MRLARLLILTTLIIGIGGCSNMKNDAHLGDQKVVIAHRGASGYLPEHTLQATAMAYAMGPDYIEPDVVLTKDGVPIVLHDIHLDSTTDVEAKFPTRYRPDGHWYAIDFTLNEIKQLNVSERRDMKSNQAVFPQRFPVNLSTFQIPTLAEQIELIQGLNKSTEQNIGIYPELKSPAFHELHGFDMGKIVLDVLAEYNYTKRSDKVFVQCFDPFYLKKLRDEHLTDLALIQLIGPNEWEISDADYNQLMSTEGLAKISEYADGIGIWMNQIKDEPEQSYVTNPNLVKDAHNVGLKVHVYTLRKDSLPSYVDSFSELHRLFYYDFDIDGAFTDFSDETIKFLSNEKHKS